MPMLSVHTCAHQTNTKALIWFPAQQQAWVRKGHPCRLSSTPRSGSSRCTATCASSQIQSRHAQVCI
eukprot:jgi/Botrbrau1/17257/Bobra.0015s0016.1